ncbi:Unconventional myosin-XIX [Vulpes lagopus]
MLQQVNGHSSGSDTQGGGFLREDLQEFLSGEAPLHQLDDLTKVNPVTLETVLRCLQARYAADTFYTNAGCTLVALNPFKPIPQLYSTALMREYHAAPQPQKLKPHIFTVGEQTYRNVKSLIEPVNQSIIVSGESGAGKTWTSRCLMKFYAVVAASPTSWESHKIAERIEQRILNSNPVMEAFGNACTLRNNNSSRFGKFIQLQLNRAQQMTGAAVQTYLLEKTRVACQASSERNFHIFYQICKGASTDERLQWHLPEGAAFSWLPNPERTLEEDCFEVTREAMLHLGIDNPTQNNIFQVLAGLLHLGNIRFADSEDEAQPCQLMGDAKCSIRTSASLLQLPEDPLLETLQIRTIRAGRQQQVFRKPCSRAECDTRRDCLAKLVYARLFDWLVSVINSSICADPDSWTTFIGLLDVYGFESFPNNSLEQLCINYANEKLQQHFVAHYLKAQQEEYTVEGLEWSFVNYQDNQTCLDLIEGSPISICSLINEVLSQLEACGLVETIHISAAGFPIRISHQNFVERYELLRRLRARTSSGPHSPSPDERHSEGSLCTEAATLQPLLQDILHTLPALSQAAATLGDPAEATPAPVCCGRTKVFMTDSMLELLEHGRAQVLEQCARCIQRGWRRHWHRKQERQRQAAVLIQAAIRSWLTRKHIQRLHTAATVIKRAWKRWRIGMAFLTSKELDGVEEKYVSPVPLSTGSCLLPQTQSSLLAAIIRLWPLGLVLANASVGVQGFRRKLVVWACLQLPTGSHSSYKVQTAQEQAGITSIRALPQGSIKFHCRKSPLPYADICPEPSPYSVTGFNQILLERHNLGHV